MNVLGFEHRDLSYALPFQSFRLKVLVMNGRNSDAQKTDIFTHLNMLQVLDQRWIGGQNVGVFEYRKEYSYTVRSKRMRIHFFEETKKNHSLHFFDIDYAQISSRRIRLRAVTFHFTSSCPCELCDI